MITLHSITLRYNERFNRWYAYTDSGLLIYFDFTICPDSDKIVSGTSYKVRGKLMPSPRYGEGQPIFICFVLDYAAA